MSENSSKITPVYLIVADDTPEFSTALYYAVRAALCHGAQLAVLYPIPEESGVFTMLGNVEAHMQSEKRRVAEEVMQQIGMKINEYGLMPSLYICEGNVEMVVHDVVNNDPCVARLILAADTESGRPGPLVSYFCGRGLSELNVPVTVVPGHLTPAAIDEFAHAFGG